MAQVKIVISGSPYVLDCDDGQEEHLVKLGTHLDSRIRELQASSKITNNIELLVVTGILLADDLSDAMAEITDLKKKLNDVEFRMRRMTDNNASGASATPAANVVKPDSNQISVRLEAMAGRMERLAESVQGN